MNLNEIESIFWGDQREQPTRVRLARVVRALRGVIDQAYSEGRASKVRGDSENVQRQWVDALINEILGDAGEKVAGVLAVESREGAMISEAPEAPATDPCPHCNGEGCTPHLDRKGNVYPEPCQHCETTGRVAATAPAPAVCVWTLRGQRWHLSCGGISQFDNETSRRGRTHCPSCGKPIKFTEAKA